MKRTPIRVLFPILILFACGTAGCSLFIRPTAVLWTSVPEFASYTEVYNSNQETFKIELVYKEHPVQALLTAEEPPDLIIGSGLISKKVLPFFAPFDKMIKNEELDLSIFYPQFLHEGVYDESQVVLPISFSMPMLMFHQELQIEDDDSIVFSYDDIWKIGKNHRVTEEGVPEKISFIPYWEPDFLFYTSYLLDGDYRESSDGKLAWDSRQIENTVEKLRKWSTEINGSLERERQFTEQHLFNPGYKLLSTGEIVLYYTDLQGFYNIPEEKRENLSFRWYGKEEEVPVSGNMLYAGIPQKGKGKKAAGNFISWFFSVDTQRTLLQNARNKRIRSFGIASGFSSLVEINEREIPRFFPEMTGHVPPEDYITPPPPLPIEWEQLKQNVLLPWFYEQTAELSDQSLDKMLETWYLQLPKN